MAAAGASHVVLLRSDGSAVGFGDDRFGKTQVPELPPGSEYVAVAAGGGHTVPLLPERPIVLSQ